ncbi:nucleotidyltransferase domain-containing protein [Peribacillus sp. TH14]|uniref:nucleotidyltransferase domain-containing protein n=1 Tax=Peribacillus sp. TH14 TaxID=2798481 RepID=UPI001911F403|nr:nucleotidyltransferase family protein [Peribacillus sp. TH14]MBK5500716.1 nucleotidyltransferase family protein [Peribacillus sp. TH14]
MNDNFKLNLNLFPKELRVLLEILKTESNEIFLLNKKELFIDINWGRFLHLARHHRVYPLIYTKLKMIDGNLIPSQVIQTLYQEYKKNTLQMLLLSGEMEKISRLFTENQIRLLFLKGPVIVADLYGAISLRTSKDLDILIPKYNLERAEELLLNDGYEREEGTTILNERKWREHHVSYFHPERKIQLEIHWRLQPYPSKEPSFDDLWDRNRISELTNYPIYFLGEEDLFLYLVSHGSRHLWFRLRWLVDIDKMLRKCKTIRINNLLTSEYQKQYITGQVLILASQLLNTPINEDMKKLMETNRAKRLAQMAIFYINDSEHLHKTVPKDFFGHKCYNRFLHVNSNIQKSLFVNRYLLSSQTNSEILFYIVKVFYPSSADAHTLRLPKPLHFLYFPLRPFLFGWRKIKKS